MSTLIFTYKAQSSQAGRDRECHCRSFPMMSTWWSLPHMTPFSTCATLFLRQAPARVSPELQCTGGCENGGHHGQAPSTSGHRWGCGFQHGSNCHCHALAPPLLKDPMPVPALSASSALLGDYPCAHPLLHKIQNSLRAVFGVSHLALGLALNGLHVYFQTNPPVSWLQG